MIVSLPFRRRCFCSPPRGGRLFPSSWEITVVLISTHAPAWGGDRPVRRRWKTCPPYFYSRPAWGATVAPIPSGQTGLFSTHAPPRGGRHQAENIFRTNIQFLLTPPRGGRRSASRSKALTFSQFLLTPPRGGRPATVAWSTAMCYFYSRPRMGGDVFDPDTGQRQLEFLLTPQNRGRTHRRGTPQAETGV